MKKANTKKSTSKSKEVKLPKIGSNSQKNKSPVASSNSKNKNTKNTKETKNLKTTTSIKKPNPISIKIDETNEKRKKRLQQEKKEEERDKKIYEQIRKEYQEEKIKSRVNTEVNPIKRLYSPKNNGIDLDKIQLPKIKISEKKTQAILEEGGMLDAYKHLVIQLCKNGLPTGNLFEYSAIVIRNYEKKWREMKSKQNKEKLEQYWKEKKEQIAKFENLKKKSIDKKKTNDKAVKEEEKKIKALNRSLEHREINKLIQSMDRSRSSRNHQDFGPFATKKKNKNENNLVVSVQQKEGSSNKTNLKKNIKQSKSPTSAKSRKSTAKSAGKAKSPTANQKKTQAKKKK